MKTSELIKKIGQLADNKFKVDINHANDSMNIGLWFNSNDCNCGCDCSENFDEGEFCTECNCECSYVKCGLPWQAWLTRPTQEQLESKESFAGEEKYDLNWKDEMHFIVEGKTMMDALNKLFDEVSNAEMIFQDCSSGAVLQGHWIPKEAIK